MSKPEQNLFIKAIHNRLRTKSTEVLFIGCIIMAVNFLYHFLKYIKPFTSKLTRIFEQ